MEHRMGEQLHGCCVDKACTEDTCMRLPDGESCNTCVHRDRCVSMFGASPDNAWCQFFPRRFRKRVSLEVA